jgi:predicted GNAT family N-acyltransferase
MPEIEIVEARTRAELEQAFAIRRAVFVEEQGVSQALEFDARDDDARHLLALCAGEPRGTLRLRWLDQGRTAKIERVAVLARERGSGIGLALLDAALALARASGAREALVHAQTGAGAFYEKLGFIAFGRAFDEDGIPHIAMRLHLSNPAHRPAPAP